MGNSRHCVSVVLPCYRGGHLVRQATERISETLSREAMDFEIVVVDDGSNDIPDDATGTKAAVRLLRLPHNQGKGAAVRAGMLAATGDVRVFTDVDLPYGAHQIPAAVRFIRQRGFHAVIGDRTLPTSLYSHELPLCRKAASAIFSMFVGRLVTGGFFDTQCGFKAFRGDVAAALFDVTRVDRFAFDVELVYVCLKHRLDIKRIPVQLRSNEPSTVRLVRDSVRGFADVLRIKLNEVRGCYRSPVLDAIVVDDYRRAAGERPSDP